MPITNYDLAIDKEYEPGTIITLSGGRTHTRFNVTGQILYFGLGVVRGASYREIAIPSADGQTFEGVVKHANTYEMRDGYTRDPATGLMGYPVDREASIVRPGDFAHLAVLVDSATNYDDPVYLRFASTEGATGMAGAFRNDDDAATAMEIGVGARFIKTVAAPAAGEVVVSHIELRW